MRPLFLIFTLFLFFSTYAFPQASVTEMRTQFETTENDTVKLNMAKQLFASYVYTKVDSAIFFAQKVVDLAEKRNSSRDVLSGNNYLGIAFTIKGDYKTAVSYMVKCLDIHIQEGDSLNMAYTYNNIGLSQIYAADFLNASDNLIKSMRIKEEMIRKNMAPMADIDLASTMLNIGIAYESQSDTLRASEYFTKAINEAANAENPQVEAKAKSSLGSLLLAQSQYEMALLYLKEAENFFVEQNDLFSLGKTYNNLALTYAELENSAEVISYAQKAIDINRQLGNELSEGLGLVYLGLGYVKTGLPEKAIDISEEALKLGHKLDAKKVISGSYENLRESYHVLGNYKKAYDYSLLYEEVEEEIYNLERTEQMERFSALYEADKRQREIDQLNQETRLQSLQLNRASTEKNLLIVLLASAVIILLLTAFLYRKIAQSRKQLRIKNQELETLNKTKDRFFAIVSHDLRGHITAFHGTGKLLKHFIAKNDSVKLDKLTDEIDHNARNIDHLLDNLLQWSVDQLHGYKPKPERINVSEVIDDLFATYKPFADAKSVELNSSVSEYDVVFADKGGLYVILRNLVSNALKFTEQGSVTVFSKKDDNHMTIGIKDTGTGIPADLREHLFVIGEEKIRRGTKNEKGTGLGLHLAYEFTRLNGGALTLESNEGIGTTFYISLVHA